MKKTATLLFLISLLIICQGQTLQTYTGDVRLHQGLLADYGRITYSYYEDASGNYIKHGKYNVTATGATEATVDYVRTKFNRKYTASATCKNGYFNGLLTIVDNLTQSSSRGTKTSTTSLTANYKDGVPHGAWNYSYKYNGELGTNFKVNFTDGMLTGPVYISYISNIKGQFSSKGEYDGKWVVESTDESLEYFFINGVLIYELKRVNGNVKNRTSEDVEELSRKYAKGELSEKDLEERGYMFKTSKGLDLSAFYTLLYDGENNFPLNYLDIAYEKTLITTDNSFGNRVFSDDTKVLGKPYKYLYKFKDIKTLTADEFEIYEKQLDSILTNILFENRFEIKKAEELWDGFFLTNEQKERLVALYDHYLKEIRPGKLERIREEEKIQEEKRIAEEKRKEEERIAEEKRKEEERIAAEKQKEYTESLSNLGEYDKTLYDFLWTSNTYTNESTPEKGKEQEAISYNAIRKELKMDEILQKSNYKALSDADITAKAKADTFVSVFYYVVLKDDYRDTLKNNAEKIVLMSKKDCPDVGKEYSTYFESFPFSKSFNSYNDLMKYYRTIMRESKRQSELVDFINVRKQIAIQNNEILATGKKAKNIVKLYTTYLDSQDLSWSQEATKEKLNAVVELQKSLLTGLKLNNIEEIDKTVKNQKITSIQEVLKLF